MAPLAGRKLNSSIIRPFFFSALFLMGTVGFVFPVTSSAALLNGALTGSIEGAYLYRDIDQGGIKNSSRGFEQRYNLKYSENLLDSRLGFFSAGINWVDDQTSFSGPVDQARRYILKDYNINVSLLPMISPLTLFAQKTERENQFDFVLHDTITTYGFGWNYAPLYLPRIGINGSHTTYSSDQSGFFPTSETDFLTLESGGRWQAYNINARYLYNQTRDEINGSYWSHGVNLNLNGALTQTLTLGAYGSYATRGGTASGMNFFQENALGGTLFYVPSKLMDGNVRFDLNETPGMEDFKRYLMSGGLNFHPTGKVDIFNNVLYTRYETGSARTDSLYANSALTYRPLFGLTLNGGLGLGMATITGGGLDSKSTQALGNWSATYFKVLPFMPMRVNAGYSGSLAQNDSDLLGRSTDSTHTLSGGLDNTQTEYIHLGVSGSWTYIDRSVTEQTDYQQEGRLSATADSHFFRHLIFFNDTLLLDGTLTYLDATGFGGISGRTYMEDFHATYQFLSMFMLLGAYSHIDHPVGYYGGNVNLASLDFSGTIQPWQNGLWIFELKELEDDRQDQYTQKTFEGSTKLSHQVGRLTLSTEYSYLNSEAGPVVTISQQFLIRAIRPF